MKKLLILLAVSFMAGSSMAAMLPVFGYDWDTLDAPANSYTLNSPTSITLTTDFYTGSSITLRGISSLINVGTTVSYDRYISGGTYLYHYRAGAIDSADAALNYYQDFTNGHEATYLPILVDPAVLTPTNNSTGVHFDFYYDSATSYIATLTDIASGLEIASGSIPLDLHVPGADIDSIDGWIFANWASDYEVTIENFMIPEPATMAILGLGGLLIRRRKR